MFVLCSLSFVRCSGVISYYTVYLRSRAKRKKNNWRQNRVSATSVHGRCVLPWLRLLCVIRIVVVRRRSSVFGAWAACLDSWAFAVNLKIPLGHSEGHRLFFYYTVVFMAKQVLYYTMVNETRRNTRGNHRFLIPYRSSVEPQLLPERVSSVHACIVRRVGGAC